MMTSKKKMDDVIADVVSLRSELDEFKQVMDRRTKDLESQVSTNTVDIRHLGVEQNKLQQETFYIVRELRKKEQREKFTLILFAVSVLLCLFLVLFWV
jgi:hypothetical protein